MSFPTELTLERDETKTTKLKYRDLVTPETETMIAKHMDFDEAIFLAMTNRQSFQNLSNSTYLQSVQVPNSLFQYPLHTTLQAWGGNMKDDRLILKILEANPFAATTLGIDKEFALNIALHYKHTPDVIERIYSLHPSAVNWAVGDQVFPAVAALEAGYIQDIVKMILPTTTSGLKIVLERAIDLKREQGLIEYILEKKCQCQDVLPENALHMEVPAITALNAGHNQGVIQMHLPATTSDLKRVLERALELKREESLIEYIFEKICQYPNVCIEYPLHMALEVLSGNIQAERLIFKLLEANKFTATTLSADIKFALHIALEHKHTPAVIEHIYNMNPAAVNWGVRKLVLPVITALEAEYNQDVIKMIFPTNSREFKEVLQRALELKREDDLIEYIFEKTRQSCKYCYENEDISFAEYAVEKGYSTRIVRMFVACTPDDGLDNLLVRAVQFKHPPETVCYLFHEWPYGTRMHVTLEHSLWYPLHFLIAHAYDASIVKLVLESSPQVAGNTVSGGVTRADTTRHVYQNTLPLHMLLSCATSDREIIKLVYYSYPHALGHLMNVRIETPNGSYALEMNPFVSAIMRKMDYDTIQNMCSIFSHFSARTQEKAVFHALEHSNYTEVAVFLISMFPGAVRRLNRMTEAEIEDLTIDDFVQRDRTYNILKNVLTIPHYSRVVLQLLSIDDTVVAESDTLAGYLLKAASKHADYSEVMQRILSANPRAALFLTNANTI